MFRNKFGNDIFQNKYATYKGQTWEEKAEQLVADVTHKYLEAYDHNALFEFIRDMKFLPGGRYIYYAGRLARFYNNCYLLKGEEDTREEWGRLGKRASDCLMSGGGIGVDYSVFRGKGAKLTRTGGTASGPIPLMMSINEIGRNVMQGGSRRSAIYASLNWQHPDAQGFLTIKDWEHQEYVPGLTYKQAKEQNFNAAAPLDMTNISLNYDNEFLKACKTGELPSTFVQNIKYAMRNGEPGFSFNFGDKQNETLRNACVSGDTLVLTDGGYIPIVDLVGTSTYAWNGKSFATVTPFETGVQGLYRVQLSDGTNLDCTAGHRWCIGGGFVTTDELYEGARLDKFSMPVVDCNTDEDLSKAYSQGFYSGDGNRGRTFSWVYEPKYSVCTHLVGRIKDSIPGRKCWVHGPMLDKSWVPVNNSRMYKLAWLAGLLDADGTVTRDKNGSGFQIASVDHEFLYELRLMLTTLGVQAKVVHASSGGYKSMPDGAGGSKDYFCKESKRLLIGNQDAWHLMSIGLGGYLNRLKHNGVQPQRDARRFVTVVQVQDLDREEMTYCFNEPTSSRGTFNGIVTGQCTEVTSEDDSDVCNLGSVNMGNISSIEEFREVVRVGTYFLVCGTLEADLPYQKVHAVRAKNRRLGLGLMGVHEWLLKRNYKYEMNPELKEWLEVYKEESEKSANWLCSILSVSQPVAYRAIAPTGTIGILAGTTTGIEPLYAVAYKRRYLEGGSTWKYQFVVDNTAQLLINEFNLDPSSIESAIDLANDPERRIKFQADVQDYVDMAISSTLNLPEYGSEVNNSDTVQSMAKIVAKYAHRLRGLTFYPDGARGGQPLVPVDYHEAVQSQGTVFEENDSCKGGVCGL